MTDDRDLSTRLTDAVSAVDGVSRIFPVQPVREAAAAVLTARPLDALVDVDRRDDDVTVVTAHVAVSDARGAPETLRAVGDLLHAACTDDGVSADAVQIIVQAKVVEGI